jgi:hypothetical protein
MESNNIANSTYYVTNCITISKANEESDEDTNESFVRTFRGTYICGNNIVSFDIAYSEYISANTGTYCDSTFSESK